MRETVLLLIVFFFGMNLYSQNLVAQYDVKKEVMGAPKGLNIQPLNLTCYYYKKADRVISFLKADYLNSYPKGFMKIENGANTWYNFILNTDSIQGISYFSLDSMVLRTGKLSGINENQWQYFDADYRQWQKLDETISIQGMQCHRAILTTDYGTPIAEIWYNPEIEMPVGMRNLINVPGLIVKATYFGTHETFSLKSFSTTTDIPDEVFWPKEFNSPFKKDRDLRRKK
ncbi:MAG: hypothetical protein IT254_11780 [Chitinophagaceae bacterium]|nr:hypothetical protein [Bacteroidota bacterium]MCC6258996.1 hypothetical protein [Chitinophagaceae bacterium]MCW5917760.1 hypothetical protein [Ferruginibacter sp.]